MDAMSAPPPTSAKLAIVALIVSSVPFMSCSDEDERTEIIVVVDTDLDIPSELSAIRVEATSPADAERLATAEALSADDLPLYVGLLRNDGPLGPFEVRAIGARGVTTVVERVARVSFVAGRTMLLELHLVAACVAASCDPGETCGVEGCRSIDIETDEYVDWTGEIPRLETDADAGG